MYTFVPSPFRNAVLRNQNSSRIRQKASPNGLAFLHWGRHRQQYAGDRKGRPYNVDHSVSAVGAPIRRPLLRVCIRRAADSRPYSATPNAPKASPPGRIAQESFYKRVQE